MKITLELQQVDALATLKTYAESKNSTLDHLIDQALVKIALNLKTKEEEENTCSSEDFYRAKLDQYPINDYVKEKLKFKYLLQKDGTVKCLQFNKVKELNYSFDVESGEAYIYLLKAGCPNKCDSKTLFGFSLMISLKELYNKIYGEGTFEKYAMKNVMKKIEASQKEWKKKKGAK